MSAFSDSRATRTEWIPGEGRGGGERGRGEEGMRYGGNR